jgi:3-hydroxyisobutyrate dehydrogenase/glyoxylate/succinic semialdehyde reductase
MKIGFIGLGIMGSRMAANLLKGGYSLVVYNRTEKKAIRLGKEKLEIMNTPEDVGRETEILFTMLSTPDAVKETALGEKGFLNSMKKNALWVDCSTVNPSFTRAMAKEANNRGVRFIDAPVSGTKGPAETGKLVFLAGGEKQDVEEITPILELMGIKIIYVGGHSMGTAMKMVINTLLGQAMLAYAEALVLGESLGIDRKFLFDTLNSLPVTAPFSASKRAKLESGDYTADFPLQWMHKDMELASITAYENDVALPLLNSTKEIYAMAKRHGYAEKDLSAVYDFLKKKV